MPSLVARSAQATGRNLWSAARAHHSHGPQRPRAGRGIPTAAGSKRPASAPATAEGRSAQPRRTPLTSRRTSRIQCGRQYTAPGQGFGTEGRIQTWLVFLRSRNSPLSTRHACARTGRGRARAEMTAFERGGGGVQARSKSPAEPRIGRRVPAHHPPLRSRHCAHGVRSVGHSIRAAHRKVCRKHDGFRVGSSLQTLGLPSPLYSGERGRG